MNHLSVAQNIFIGREPKQAFGLLLDERALNARAEELLARLNLVIDPRTVVGSLTVAKQQMVEIAKALSYNCRVAHHGRADRGAQRRRNRANCSGSSAT